jgi:hypothetical protein
MWDEKESKYADTTAEQQQLLNTLCDVELQPIQISTDTPCEHIIVHSKHLPFDGVLHRNSSTDWQLLLTDSDGNLIHEPIVSLVLEGDWSTRRLRFTMYTKADTAADTKDKETPSLALARTQLLTYEASQCLKRWGMQWTKVE